MYFFIFFYKYSNILLKNDTIKIADLGLAKNLTGNKTKVRSFVGSPKYWSPEMIKFKLDKTINITFKTDIWSIGIVIYELLTLKRPFQNDNEILSLDTPNFIHLIHDYNVFHNYHKNLFKNLIDT